MSITFQVLFSILLVAVVYFFMWRMPRKGEAFFEWGPPLALASAWIGLLSLIVSIVMRWLPYPDYWLWGVLWLLAPLGIGSGSLVLWIYRRYDSAETTIDLQRTQAKVGVTLGVIAFGLCYWFVMSRVALPPE